MINDFNKKTEQYLADESFRVWVLQGGFRNPDDPWSQWFSQNQENSREALKAREMILATQVEEAPFADDYFETIRRETLKAVKENKTGYLRPLVWKAAAAVILLCGLLGWFVQNNQKVTQNIAKAPELAPVENLGITRENNTLAIIPVALPDGSSVLLHPKSSLKYTHVPGGNREVRLTGKAFFEVAKDPSHPFFVYAGEMVTRVIGTSFTITAYSSDADFSVAVKTGKVAVSAMPEEEKKSGKDTKNNTVNLVPNELLVFNRETLLFKRKDLKPTEMLRYVPATQISYAFEETPVVDIFHLIADAYGLKIDMPASVFAGCELTTNLTDEPLFEKLDIVCNAVGPGTSYVVEEGHIRVLSNGCNQ